MKDMKQYMELSREARRKHLKLKTQCDERGGSSKEFRGLLAHFLDTNLPSGKNIHLCHACNNGKCSNPKHLYWGTSHDNHLDQVENGTYKSITERTIEKYGRKKFVEQCRKIGKANKGKTGRKYSPEKIEYNRSIIIKYDTSKWGWLGKCAIELDISHTQLRRFINLHAQDLV